MESSRIITSSTHIISISLSLHIASKCQATFFIFKLIISFTNREYTASGVGGTLASSLMKIMQMKRPSGVLSPSQQSLGATKLNSKVFFVRVHAILLMTMIMMRCYSGFGWFKPFVFAAVSAAMECCFC